MIVFKCAEFCQKASSLLINIEICVFWPTMIFTQDIFSKIAKWSYRIILMIFLHMNMTRGIGQSFQRSELPAKLEIPWEMSYGKDGNLWISESQGRIVKVHPKTGYLKQVYKAPDYADADSTEVSPYCFRPKPGSGCLGLALHPDFSKDSPYVFLFYSYHHSIKPRINTAFKIAKLTLDNKLDTVIAASDIVLNLPTGFDHLGGRMIAVKEKAGNYLYVSIGDHGISEESNPDCYINQSLNPNNQAQNPLTLNGKILRYHLDGSIPRDNPLPDNPFFTRGHRNPQGMAWNVKKGILYEIEHGNKTDDEVNILQSGMNYGWKSVRGYGQDGNWPGEIDTVRAYKPFRGIANDKLVDPLYVWCNQPQPLSVKYTDWCTVAPSDAVHYQSGNIPFLKNCLLVTTLKRGVNTEQQVFALRLTEDGRSIAQAELNRPSVFTLFGEDGVPNGRLRDIAVSHDGFSIYLINNGGIGSVRDKIICYTYQPGVVKIYPNPAQSVLNMECDEGIQEIQIYNLTGERLFSQNYHNSMSVSLEISGWASGMYLVNIQTAAGKVHKNQWVRL